MNQTRQQQAEILVEHGSAIATELQRHAPEVQSFMRDNFRLDLYPLVWIREHAEKLAALRAAPAAPQETDQKHDHGAGLIGANDTGHGDTLPRPNCACDLCKHVTNYQTNIANTIDAIKEALVHPEYERLVDDLAHMAQVYGYHGNQPLSEASGSAQSAAPSISPAPKEIP